MAFIHFAAPCTARTSTFIPSASRRTRSIATERRCRTRATLGEKFGNLRGAKIATVSEAVEKFQTQFARPVPIVYRAIINELLTTSHLAIVCALWRYDALFAAGFEHVFEAFLAYYPNVDERARLRLAVTSALNLDPKLLAADATTVREWAESVRTADAVFAAVDGEESNAAIAALKAPKNAANYEWYYSRCYGIGLITVMQAVGVELSVANAESWADRLAIERSKLSAEMGVYLSSMERLKQAEQIFAEAAAREAKKTADRLARRAEAAAKKLEQLEKKGPDAPADPVDTATLETKSTVAPTSTASSAAATTTTTTSNDENA